MSHQSSEAAAAELTAEILAGRKSVSDVLGPIHAGERTLGLNPDIQMRRGGKEYVPCAPAAAVSPADEANEFLVKHVGPLDRPNPEPSDDYDLVVVGAGVAGLLSSIMGKALGKRVAMVERHYMGGDCLNVGCFPSKALIACARRAHEVRTAAEYGVHLGGGAEVTVDFPFIMQRMRKLRSEIAPHDSVDRYQRDFNEHVFLGDAEFESGKRVVVTRTLPDGSKTTTTLKYKKAMVATGGSARVPSIPGFLEVPHLTNMTLFNLEELPPRIVLIGAGPIGIEMAQTMARFGSKVIILEYNTQILVREDPDAAECVQQYLADHEPNLEMKLSVAIDKVSVVRSAQPGEGVRTKGPWDAYSVEIRHKDGRVETVAADAVLNATGRVPNVFGIGLEKAGVEYDTQTGVHVDDFFKTTNDDIYACGDVASPFKFTHAADWQARTAIRNMFLGVHETQANLLTPWCTYTEPEISHVGKYESELEKSGVEFTTYKRMLKDVDRCKCEGVTEGFVKITCAKGTDKILGATIVGPNAGDLISELTVCMTSGVGVSTLAGIIHPYPTTAEALRQCAAQYWQQGNLKTPLNNEVIRLLLAEKERQESAAA